MKTFEQSLEFCNYFYVKSRDNLFSADHRNKMLHRYGYTNAMLVTVGELNDGKTVANELNRLMK